MTPESKAGLGYSKALGSDCFVGAVNDRPEGYEYPERVRLELQEKDLGSYRRAALLDLEDPSKVIGRLGHPLLVPEGQEREGYVPNVVYSCGSLVHGRDLILPFAVSDRASAIATVSLDDLLAALLEE